MRSVSIYLLLCLAAMLLTDVTCQMNGRTCPCLRKTNTVVPKENITNYKRQISGICHIDAIVFTTVNNRKVCANPEKPWVKEAIEYLDNKKKTSIKSTEGPVNSTATYKTTPTANATSHLNTGCLKSLLT